MSRRIYHHDGYISEPEIRHVSTHTTQGKRPTDTLRRIHERSTYKNVYNAFLKFIDKSIQEIYINIL